MKTREEWEQELRDRQRPNIVPDLAKSQAYSRVLSGKFLLRPLQRVLLFSAGSLLLFGATYFLVALIIVMTTDSAPSEAISRVPRFVLMGLAYIIGLKMIFRAVFSPQPPSRLQ